MKIELCKTDQISQDEIKRYNIENHDILITKQGDQFYAFENICPHFGVPLEDGSLSEKSITCKEHGIRFDIVNGDQLNRHYDECDQLKVYSIEIESGSIFVELD